MSLFTFFKDVISRNFLKDPTSKIVFDHYFFDLKYYLHIDASIADFSNLLNITSEKIDHISKEYYSCSFDILLNEHRYQHFVKELVSHHSTNLTIESIIKLSGFENNKKFSDFVKSKELTALSIKESISQ